MMMMAGRAAGGRGGRGKWKKKKEHYSLWKRFQRLAQSLQAPRALQFATVCMATIFVARSSGWYHMLGFQLAARYTFVVYFVLLLIGMFCDDDNTDDDVDVDDDEGYVYGGSW